MVEVPWVLSRHKGWVEPGDSLGRVTRDVKSAGSGCGRSQLVVIYACMEFASSSSQIVVSSRRGAKNLGREGVAD
jgi:hypothetical protein